MQALPEQNGTFIFLVRQQNEWGKYMRELSELTCNSYLQVSL